MRREFIGRWLLLSVVILTSAGCVPLPSDAGGSIPPPEIDTNVPPGTNPGNGGGGDDGFAGQSIFDVTINASSLMIGGIAVEAELMVNTVQMIDGTTRVTGFSLRDTVNDPGATFGLSGGISLISTDGGTEFFTVTDSGNGDVTATFRSTSGASDESNVFIVQDGGGAFNPGEMGIGYAVQAGSSVSFSINGSSVTGMLDLTGTPINTTGGSDVYVGTFAGTRRGS